jgi:glycosyltransferase involved in cell wall biosynthesis
MRILQVAHAFPPTFGGVETHLWDLSHSLTRKDHEVYCLVGGDKSVEKINKIKIQRSPHLTVQFLLKRREGFHYQEINFSLVKSLSEIISKVIQEFNPELIHLHNAHHFAPELAYSFFEITKIPLINSIHDRVGEHIYFNVLSYPWSHLVYASQYLFDTIPTDNQGTVLRLGIDLSSFSSEGDIDERFSQFEEPIIFHPARLLKWKGVEVGLKAFILIRKHINKGTLVLCDSKNIVDDPVKTLYLKSALILEAKNAGIEDNLKFLTFDKSKIAQAYRASDFIWYPTIDEEPFGLVPLEAMACGIPLIVSNSGGMKETVRSNYNGIIVPKNDPKALAESVLTLLSDKNLSNFITKNGKEVVQEYDIGSYVSKLEKIYEQARVI